MIFFVAQRDVALTMKTAVGGVLGVTVAIALCFVCYLLTLDEPALRLPAMVVLAFGGLYLMRATPVAALGLLVGFFSYYGLTLPGQLPSPEGLVRALLWIWVVVAYPMVLLGLSDLAFGARPDEVYRSGVADRLAGAIAVLEAPAARHGKAWVRLQRLARLGASDLLPYVARAGSAATAPIRATLLRYSELLGLLVRELPDEARHDPAAQPILGRASRACAAARDALLQPGRATHVEPAPDVDPRELGELTPAARAAVVPLVNCVRTIVLSVQELGSTSSVHAAPSVNEPKPAAPDKGEAVRFAAKVTFAAMTAYLLYSSLEWYGIHTATITCFFVAQDSVGATIHKLTLRLAGAIIGATLGMLAIVFVLPAFETIGGLLVLVAAVTLLAAWVGTGSQRIAYMGWQIALAFYLTVLQGFSRTSNLTVGRDRVIGILVGNIIISVVFTSIWPVRATAAARQALSGTIEALAAMLRSAPAEDGALAQAEASYYAQLTRTRQYLPALRFERARGRGSALLTVVQGLFVPIHAIMRTPVPESASAAARAALASAPRQLADWLHRFAASVASVAPAPPAPPLHDDLVALRRVAGDDNEPTEARQRLADQVRWIELLRAQCAAMTERPST
jgi:multidrug resistance protein MdtO